MMQVKTHGPLSEDQYKLFRELVEEKSGIHIDEVLGANLADGLRTRLAAGQFKTFSEYYNHLVEGVGGYDEFKHLLDLVTVKETFFLRGRANYRALAAHVLPPLINRQRETGQPIRIWSPGCATGEEPYSILLTAMELFGGSVEGKLEVLATDISRGALEVARAGVYGSKALKYVDDHLLSKYFKKCGSGCYKLFGSVRNQVRFEFHNLNQRPYPMPESGRWDIIFCCNVFIYFNAATTRRVLSGFTDVLDSGGHLFIGGSETLIRMTDLFTPVRMHDGFVWQLNGSHVSNESDEPDSKPRKKLRSEAKKVETVKDSKRLGQLLDKANELYRSQRLDDAMDIIEADLLGNLETASLYVLYSKVLLDLGDLDGAARACLRAIELDSLTAQAHYLLGIIYSKRNKLAEAIGEFGKAVYADERFALAHFGLANAHRSLGKMDRAIREYENTIDCLKRTTLDQWREFAGGYSHDYVTQICRLNVAQIKKLLRRKSKREGV